MLNKILYSGYINFESLIIDNYYRIGLSETEALILIKLYRLRQNTTYLSIKTLAKETSLSIEDLDKVIQSLTNKGFVTFEVKEVNGVLNESFSIKNTLDKIFSFEESLDSKEVVKVVEENFKRLLSARELDIVRQIKCSNDELTRGIIICHQYGKYDVNYLKKVIENGENYKNE